MTRKRQLTPEQDELRLRGLRILARMIVALTLSPKPIMTSIYARRERRTLSLATSWIPPRGQTRMTGKLPLARVRLKAAPVLDEFR